MSINDLLNDDNFLLYLFALLTIILLFALPIGISISRRTNENIYGGDVVDDIAPLKILTAKVIARRTSPHPLNQGVSINMVAFELENGERVELAIKDSTVYGVLVEGDTGELTYQGKKFIQFKRTAS